MTFRRHRLFRRLLTAALLILLVPILLELPALESVKYALWGFYALHQTLRGRLVRAVLPAPSLQPGARRECWIYLPPGWGEKPPDGGYPVLILLHGTPGAPIDWIIKGGAVLAVEDAILAHDLPPLLLVLPDGRGPGPRGSSLYVGNIERWIAQDVPRDLIADWHAAHNPDRWIIAGESEGGFGALNLLSRYPNRFHTAVALSPMLSPRDAPTAARQLLGRDPAAWQAYEVRSNFAALPTPNRFFVSLSVGDQDRYDHGETALLARFLTARQVTSRFTRSPGTHGWRYWSRAFAQAIRELPH